MRPDKFIFFFAIGIAAMILQGLIWIAFDMLGVPHFMAAGTMGLVALIYTIWAFEVPASLKAVIKTSEGET